MDKIEIGILNPEEINEARRMMACCARLTQHGHEIRCAQDFMDLYLKPASSELTEHLAMLPHPTLQKFGVINVVVVGASRRFLAQITRHQNEVKFMSASLQYSDYSGSWAFVTPYEILGTPKERAYYAQCKASMEKYQLLVESGVSNDTAGYLAPQGLRNVLVISATPYQWKHMIGQRVCRRNTDETRYIMLRIWDELWSRCPEMFKDAGPFCENGVCQEGVMSCGMSMNGMTPAEILLIDFPKIYGEL